MAKQQNNFTCYRGDTKVWTMLFQSAPDVPIDITGHVLWFTMKAKVTDTDDDAVIQKNITFAGGEDSSAGKGFLTLTSEETGVLVPGSYVYDMQKVINETPPVVSTVLSGRITILADVTQRNGV